MQEFLHCQFFKTNIKIFKISFSENISIILLQFFTEDGLAYRHKIMTSYLRLKHNVFIGKKRVDTALSMVSQQFRSQRRTWKRRAVNLILYRADYIDHKLHIDENENLKVCCLSFMLKFLIYKQLRLSYLNYLC